MHFKTIQTNLFIFAFIYIEDNNICIEKGIIFFVNSGVAMYCVYTDILSWMYTMTLNLENSKNFRHDNFTSLAYITMKVLHVSSIYVFGISCDCV